MEARRSFFALLLAGFLMPWVPPVGADGESWSARLVEANLTYGPESWKYYVYYDNPTSPASLLSHAQNQTVSYHGALGARLQLRIDIYDEGNPSATTDLA